MYNAVHVSLARSKIDRPATRLAKIPNSLDSSYEEIFRELAFKQMVEQGLKDSREGRVITNEEMHKRIRKF